MKPAVLATALGATVCWAGAMQVQTRRTLAAERARYRAALERAHTCPTTSLPLRAAWRPQAEAVVAAVPTAEVAFADLDGFKSVNDRAGHHVGDRVLAAVAERLRALLPDAVIGRAGGDEFVLISPRPVDWDAVVREIRRRYRVDNGRGGTGGAVIGISIGVVRSDCCHLSDLLRVADDAMYEVKERGGGVQWAHDAVRRPAGKQPANCSSSAPDEAPERMEPPALTHREREIAELVAEGRTNKEIADHLVIAETTVKWHVRRVMRKLSVDQRCSIFAALRALGDAKAEAAG